MRNFENFEEKLGGQLVEITYENKIDKDERN